MVRKQIEAMGHDDILWLIENEVHEGRSIDYKLILPDKKDPAKVGEFLADVSSFANASGGDLYFGVAEAKGVPQKAVGVMIADKDAERRWIDQITQQWVEPRIPRIQVGMVEGFENGPVVIVRIPQGWGGPHMVTYEKSVRHASRFYSRNNHGKYQLDLTEIRSAFTLSQDLPERVKRFRDKRITQIEAGETPIGMMPDAKLVLHVVPVAAFSAGADLSVTAIAERVNGDSEFWRYMGDSRYNADGLLLSMHRDDSPLPQAYYQFFRSGVLEAVETRIFSNSENTCSLDGGQCEEVTVRLVQRQLSLLRELSIPPPFVILMTLAGVSGVHIPWINRTWRSEAKAIDRDLILLPDVLIEDYEDISIRLKPMFDGLWNAGGYARSPYYDADGRPRQSGGQ